MAGGHCACYAPLVRAGAGYERRCSARPQRLIATLPVRVLRCAARPRNIPAQRAGKAVCARAPACARAVRAVGPAGLRFCPSTSGIICTDIGPCAPARRLHACITPWWHVAHVVPAAGRRVRPRRARTCRCGAARKPMSSFVRALAHPHRSPRAAPMAPAKVRSVISGAALWAGAAWACCRPLPLCSQRKRQHFEARQGSRSGRCPLTLARLSPALRSYAGVLHAMRLCHGARPPAYCLARLLRCPRRARGLRNADTHPCLLLSPKIRRVPCLEHVQGRPCPRPTCIAAARHTRLV